MMTTASADTYTETVMGSFTRIVLNVRKKPISTIALQLLGDTNLQNSYVWELDLMDDTDCFPFIVRFHSDDWVLSGSIHVGSIVYFREIQYIQCQLHHQPVQIRFIPRLLVIDESSSLLIKLQTNQPELILPVLFQLPPVMSYLPPLYDSNSFDKRDFFWKKQRRLLYYPSADPSQSGLTPFIQGIITAKSTISDYSSSFPNFAYPLTFFIQLYDGNRYFQVSFFHERVMSYYYNLRIGDVIRISSYQIPESTSILNSTPFLQLDSQSPSEQESIPEYMVPGKGDIHDVQLLQTGGNDYCMDYISPLRSIDQLPSNSSCWLLVCVTSITQEYREVVNQDWKAFRWMHAIDDTSTNHIIIKLYLNSQKHLIDSIHIGHILLLTNCSVISIDENHHYFIQTTSVSSYFVYVPNSTQNPGFLTDDLQESFHSQIVNNYQINITLNTLASNITIQWIRRKRRGITTSIGRLKGEKAYLRYLNNTNWSGPIFQHIMQINQIPSLRVGQFVYGILKGKVIQIDDKRKWMWLSDGSGITRIDITEARIDSIRVSDYELQEIVCGVLCVNQPPFTLQLVCVLS
ncbi:hypothetical protein WA171_002652 [Blastocystis sp. BT1]